MKSKPAKKLEIVPNPEVVKREYARLYFEKKAMEARLEKLKPMLERVLEKEPEWKAETEIAHLGMCEKSREFVTDLEGLKAKIDNRVLRPHLKMSTYREIRVRAKGPTDSSDSQD